MNRKKNVSYIKPEDPEFIKNLKRQAGYDDSNHKFDKLQNNEEDFVEDDDSELPQVVVLKKGDLTLEEAEMEKKIKDIQNSEVKADLSKRVIFKSKLKSNSETNIRKHKCSSDSTKSKKSRPLLSFGSDHEDD